MFAQWRTCMLATLLGVMAAATSAWAQEDGYGGGGYEGDYEGYDYGPRRGGAGLRNQFDLELIGFLSSSLSFRYERVLTRHLSLALHPLWWWGFNDGGEGFDFGIQLQMRWYPEGHAMRGWYISPQVGYFQVNGIDELGYKQTDRSWTYALVAGYNWIVARAFSLYFGGGIAYTQSSNNLDADYWHYYPVYALGPFPVFEFGIGVPF